MIRREVALCVAAAALLVGLCSASTLRTSAMRHDESMDKAFTEWSYETGMTGPDHFGPEAWYLIHSKYSMCEYSVMGEQSPINLYEKPPNSVTLEDAKSEVRQKFKYRKPLAAMRNTGRVIEMVVKQDKEDPPGGVLYRSNHYELRKISFHTPSEHTFGTKFKDGHAAMEMQLFHQLEPPTSGATMWVVVSVLFEQGPENGFITSLLKEIPPPTLEKLQPSEFQKHGNFTIGPIDIHSILDPLGDKYFTYSGSMTTPPCMEDVRWFVMHDTLKISSAQMEAIKGNLGDYERRHGNARPTMPVNLRNVYFVH